MSRYRKVVPRFWKDEKVRRLDHDHKLIPFYLITGQSNRIGLFSLSPGMAAEDTGLTVETFTERCRNVCRALKWEWDEQAGVVYIPTWWKYNQPENPNNVIGCLTDLADVPNSPLVARFCANVEHLGPHLAETFRQTLAERYPKRLATPEQEQEQEQEPTPSAAGAAVRRAPIETEILTGSENGTSRNLKRREDDPPGFAAFWARYPKARKRGDAVKAWRKINPANGTREAIMAGLDRYIASEDWAREGGRFIQHPATWLNARCWEDDPAPASGLSQKTAGNVDVGHRFIAKLQGGAR